MRAFQLSLKAAGEPMPIPEQREPVLRIARRWLRQPSPVVRFESAAAD